MFSLILLLNAWKSITICIVMMSNICIYHIFGLNLILISYWFLHRIIKIQIWRFFVHINPEAEAQSRVEIQNSERTKNTTKLENTTSNVCYLFLLLIYGFYPAARERRMYQDWWIFRETRTGKIVRNINNTIF